MKHEDFAGEYLQGCGIEIGARGEEINIHFHVFEPRSFEACRSHPQIEFDLEIARIEEAFPEPEANGFLAVLQKGRSAGPSIWQWAQSYWERKKTVGYPMKPDAAPFMKKP